MGLRANAGKVGTFGTLGIALGICATLTFFSNLWLRRFSSGPFEIVWRWLSLVPFGSGKKR